jgi:hypothetical protein
MTIQLPVARCFHQLSFGHIVYLWIPGVAWGIASGEGPSGALLNGVLLARSLEPGSYLHLHERRMTTCAIWKLSRLSKASVLGFSR